MMGEDGILLEAEIRKKLRDFQLEVSFAAGRGCLGLLGPSGCGKSMTLKSIAGILAPDEGRIALNGGRQVLFDSRQRISLSPQKRRAGYLFQNYALFPNMTVRENIMSGLGAASGHRRASQRKERAEEMMERFRLKGLGDRYPGQLSGGQQQRVALARILAYEPQTLLLDEPFSAMDAYLREELRLELAGVLKDYAGASVLVTHDRDEAYQLCSHLVLMKEGRVLAKGKTRELFQNPGTWEAARLTGCKNISPVRRLGPFRVKALAWGGLELETDQPVGEEVCAVGIRAHDFCPLSEGEAEAWEGRPGANRIPVGKPSISEMPFEWHITLENGIWWKKEKDIHTHDAAGVIPPWLRVDPSAILLLKGEAEPTRQAFL